MYEITRQKPHSSRISFRKYWLLLRDCLASVDTPISLVQVAVEYAALFYDL